MNAINSVAPALIAGNVVIFKHASQTPFIRERMAKTFHSACDVQRDLWVYAGTPAKTPGAVEAYR